MPMQMDVIASDLSGPAPVRKHRILVACHDMVLNGGLQRFEKAGLVLRNWGHEVAFVTFAEAPSFQWQTELPVLSLDEASTTTWDAVMVPGAGFREEVIERFALLRGKKFGVRVQHVLNDQSRRANFEMVNRSFSPHLVIFNNLHWEPGSFSNFDADRFHVLLGAVDTRTFRPKAYRTHPLRTGRWVIGGLASKNPDPLVSAVASLPDDTVLQLFGMDTYGLAEQYSALVTAGRLQLAGPLHGDALARFYHEVDCIAMTETYAGWSNLVAEAMASGVPVVCTPNGTPAAQHDETAVVISRPTPAALTAGLGRLRSDRALCCRLAENARHAVERYSWDAYARQLLQLIQHNGRRHYTYAPEIGLFGKWPLSDRLAGIGHLLERTGGLSVADFGCSEGVIAREFLRRGAVKVHGFDVDPERIRVAKAVCSLWSCAAFRTADLSEWDSFVKSNSDLLDESYDMVLYLGIQHHLPVQHRLVTLRRAIGLARQYFAIRTSAAVYETDGIDSILKDAGFRLLEMETPETQSRQLGLAKVYERVY